jgi:hypothetical protein
MVKAINFQSEECGFGPSSLRENHHRGFQWNTALLANRPYFTPFLCAMVDWQARERIQALEERAVQRDRETAELSARLSRGAADFARLAATVEAMRASRPHPLPAGLANPPTPALTSLRGRGRRTADLWMGPRQVRRMNAGVECFSTAAPLRASSTK